MSVRIRIGGGYLAVVLLLAVVWIFVYVGTHTMQRQINRVVTVNDALAFNVAERQILVDDEETGLRGYLLTGKRVFLQPYERARAPIAQLRQQSTKLVIKEPNARIPMARLTARGIAWEKWAANTLEQGISGQSKEQLVADLLVGKSLFDEYRSAAVQANTVIDRDRRQQVARSTSAAADLILASGILFVLALILTLVAGWMTGNAVTRPLKALARAATAIGGGDLERVVAVGGDREFRQLAHSVDDMRVKLREAAQAEAAARNAQETLLQERTEAAAYTAAVNADLVRSNQEMETFAYSVSHDLRQPLRALDGFGHALLEDYGDILDPTAQGYLARIRAATQRMGELIDGMLMLSRLSRAGLRVDEVDLSALVRAKCDALSQTAPDRDVSFVIQDDLTVRGDARLLQIALANLLENAWKFTRKHESARIEFGKFVRDGSDVYFVRDDGAGFNMKYQKRLFEVFQRLHPLDEFGGSGLGLATVQRIVHRHGGIIWPEAEVEHGATIYFTLSGRGMTEPDPMPLAQHEE